MPQTGLQVKKGTANESETSAKRDLPAQEATTASRPALMSVADHSCVFCSLQ